MSNDKERFDWLVNRVDTMLGMKCLVIPRSKDQYDANLVYYSPTMIELGATSFTLNSHFGDILFGHNTGMFMSRALSDKMPEIVEDFHEKFPNSGG